MLETLLAAPRIRRCAAVAGAIRSNSRGGAQARPGRCRRQEDRFPLRTRRTIGAWIAPREPGTGVRHRGLHAWSTRIRCIAPRRYEKNEVKVVAKVKNGFVSRIRDELFPSLKALQTANCPFKNLPVALVKCYGRAHGGGLQHDAAEAQLGRSRESVLKQPTTPAAAAHLRSQRHLAKFAGGSKTRQRPTEPTTCPEASTSRSNAPPSAK